MESKWKLDWDYLWWKEKNIGSELTQNDWNQTLVTRINQISTHIHMSTLVGGANTITLNNKIFSLIESFEYTKKQDDGTYKLSERYNIIFDDSLPLDKIFVSYEGLQKDYLVIVEGQVEGMPSYSYIHSESPNAKEYLDNPNVKIITPDMLVGEITIINI